MVANHKQLQRNIKKLNIPSFASHAFRHTHASLLLNTGIGYKELQHRLGHTTLSMTMDIYGHISKDREKQAFYYFEQAVNNL
ncbi:MULTISPECIES: tyrosine-type recombinase/integrase [unclassified Granulicatella]|uniref:tyrosine-type recombinase/integrase n=1 Tax=unclassified Granulicatella TaxID=2630493 RepID=UPI001073CA0B|nr:MULTISPECIES: tyrosine-type recombinase/integrase [unclassified Granulicatella]MBF0779769.1 tyrosine-type recombinase/integrase [Granulicatella sp. 19428wC4_WM01]TFU96171.1 hypothetical protein E4T68_01555 [Granulicatella sp. WM01]